MLDGFVTTLDETFDALIDDARQTDGGVRVSDLMAAARESGLSARESWRAAVEACDEAAVQESWIEWEEVPDQAELGLRLQVLADAPQIVPKLADFLFFFFRASAPELYRPAALAIGRHSWTYPALFDGLETYAEQRDLAVDGPISLTGDRSRRRLLMATTARHVHAPEGHASRAFPVEVEPMSKVREHPIADIAVLCLCSEFLLAAGIEDEAFVQLSWELAESIHGFLGQGGSQRGLVRAWGQMLGALERLDADRAVSTWSDTLVTFEQRDDRTYSEHLATFWEFDAAIVAGVDGETDFLKRADVDEIGELFNTSDLRWLSRIRRWQWQLRRNPGSTQSFTQNGWSDGPGRETADPEIAVFLEMVVDRVAGGEELHRAVHRWIASRIDRLTDSSRWWARPDESRALGSFLVLDAVRYRPPPRATLCRLFDGAGISRDAPQTSAGSEVEGIAGLPWEGFHDLLWQIFRLEGAPADFPVESESFASIGDAERLLGFIRAGQTVRDLDILVDALEHFLRLELASEGDFEPRRFLYRVAARKPHPSLFVELARRTRGRTYIDESGTEVNLRQMLEAVAASTEDWFPELQQARGSLKTIDAFDDLQDALHEFADQIDPRIPDSETHHRGLVALLVRTVPDDGELLADSTATEGSTTADELTAAVADQMRVLRQMTAELFDNTAADFADMHRATRNISARLNRILEHLSPYLAAGDTEILRATTSRLQQRLAAWTNILEHGLETPLTRVSWPLEDAGREVFEELRDVTRELASNPMQVRAFRLAYEWLQRRHPATSGDPAGAELPLDESEYWEFERELLAAAATTTDELDLGAEWLSFLAERWERLATVAMELQAEPHVVDLVRSGDFAPLRRRARHSVTVERLEQWLADRYHLPALSALIGNADAGERRWLPPMFRATTRMVSNFTHVWLALLVGAVMLLDFGDAWVELARQGDISGIAITVTIGLGGTFLYLLADIFRKTDSPFNDPNAGLRVGRLARIVAFFGVCFVYTVLVTGGLWYLFSATDLVIRGDGATLHILVWTGFALFVGVFFGLLTDAG